MLRSFDKKNRDKITFEEFTSNIRNNKLDDNFNVTDQMVRTHSLTYILSCILTYLITYLIIQELFKLVEKHQDASGAIPIKDIIGCVDQRVAISDTNYKKDMFAIRDFLANQLKKHRDKKLIEQDIVAAIGTHLPICLLTHYSFPRSLSQVPVP